MSQWVDAYVVEDEDGQYFELFGDHTLAEDYVKEINQNLRVASKQLIIRHTIVDIAD